MKNLTNQKFGKLTALRIDHKSKGRIYWLCHCECGIFKCIRTSDLIRGHSKSCGCYQKEVARQKQTKNIKNCHAIYRSFYAMKDRCYNKNSSSYFNYGGRGITICDEWLNDNNIFVKWSLEYGYQEGLTIDRINVNGNYSPLNCRWLDRIGQNNNRRNNHLLTIEGKTQTVAEWGREVDGLNAKIIADRIRLGWSVKKALLTPKLR